jgi:putative flippase GtrA
VQVERSIARTDGLPTTRRDFALVGYVSAHAAELGRFVVIGAALATLNLSVLYVLRTWLHVPVPIALTVMYVVGVLAHFPSHRLITYRAQGQPLRPQLLRYAALLLWNFVLLQLLVALAAKAGISPYFAFMGSTGLNMAVNFLFMTHVVFARREIELSSVPAQALEALRQRGVRRGTVLLLADRPTHPRGRGEAHGFAVSYGAISEQAPVADRGVAAVVVVTDGLAWSELESHLAAIARRLEKGMPLVLVLRAPRQRSSEDRQRMHLLLLRAGYHQVWVHAHGSSLCVSATRAAPPASRMCSIIVPVFNERATFPALMRQLLDKRLDHLGLERQIILVESNSTDGTRELVAGFAGTPDVTILWQERPCGKGNAVREGLKVASGDIVLIQDADLEYDLNDYEALLEPLLGDRTAFVLGSRHSGRARMRKFTDQRLLGVALDAAHVLFTAVINVLYGQKMKDPFTMFKVMRRDCLYGLEFECDRFDFDHELLIKLLKKGYRPLEIPVSYCSRSFKQGKKIRLFRDPPGWIRADIKYRLQRLRPHFK